MRSLFLIVPGLIAAAPAAAQSVADADAGNDVIVTANRTPQSPDEVGQSVSVLTAADIAARQSQAVVDLLRTVPGVSFTRAGGVGTAASVNIRGADPQQTLLLIDGVKIDDPASPGGGYDFGNLLVGNIDRIEVVRGSQSVIWGSRAIGGVINVITRRPTEDPEVIARAEYGWRDTVSAVANAAGTFGPVSASVGGNYLTTDGVSAFDEAIGGRERDGYRNYGANAKADVAVSEAFSIDLRGRYSNGRVDLDGFAPPSFAFGDTGDRSTTRELTGYAGAKLALIDGRFTNRAGIAYSRIDRTNFDATDTSSFDSRGTNRRIDYQGTLSLGSIGGVFGAENEVSRFRTESFGARSSARARINSVYGELTVRPVPGVALSGGARHDDHDRFGGATTFAANAVATPNGGATRLRASYGEGFGAPSLFQLYSDFGNDDLVPERSKSWDAGVVQRLLSGAAEAGVTYFHRDTRDQIDFASCFGNASPICVGRPFGTYDNIRATRAKGVEAALTLRPIDPFTVRMAYTYLDARDRTTGRELARRPRETASVVADWQWTRGLSTGFTIAHVGDSFDNATNSRRLDGYVLADVRAGVMLDDRIELYGRIENLFDEGYQTVFQYGTPGRAAYAGVRLRL